MAKKDYSRTLCKELIARIRELNLRVPYRLRRYEDGDSLELQITTAWPEADGRARFHIEKFVGGGFAGQVYRCRLESLDLDGAPSDSGLAIGGKYAVKIMIPPSRFSARFRDFVYRLAFQAPFSAQVLQSACRSGLLWPKLLRVASTEVFGDREAVADTYASFYDDNFRAYGEVREWVEGRTWRLESDTHLGLRRQWRTIDPKATESPEFVAKHQFMVRLVQMLHDMGAPELARQYEWTTMKSQPNALKRTSGGSDPASSGRYAATDPASSGSYAATDPASSGIYAATDPAAGLCAVDFRAGLALVPYLPMSPGDFGLILNGLMRGSLAQFDRCDFKKLRAYVADRPEVFGKDMELIDALERYDGEYRRAMPDLSHQGLRLLVDGALRRDVRRGLVAGYWSDGLVDQAMVEKLERGGPRFTLFYLLGVVPVLGKFLRRLWGNSDFRQHVGGLLSSLGYLRESGKASAAAAAIDWHRGGRVGEAHARLIADHVPLFWLERLTVRLLPFPVLHRVLCEPWRVYFRMREGFQYMRRFFRDAEFREAWLREQVEDGYREGMLHDEERDAILAQLKDPFIAQYLKSVGVHLATLPVTQIVSVIVGAIVAVKVYAIKGDWRIASASFFGVLGIFQITPISPGSICRGLYVVFLMIRDRNFRDYMVAAPLSFVKYIGYLAFPLQMVTAHPAFSQFMAGRWATSAVHVIPVFGEKGALVEHMVFDAFFNVPRVIGALAARHVKGILNFWLLLGLLFAGYVFGVRGVDWSIAEGVKMGVNTILWVVCVFGLPRVLFYPVLHGRRGKRKDPDHG